MHPAQGFIRGLNGTGDYGRLIAIDSLTANHRLLPSTNGVTFTSFNSLNAYVDGAYNGTNLCLINGTVSVLTDLNVIGSPSALPVTFVSNPAIAYSKELGIFVAGSAKTAGITCMISSNDGLNWTERLSTGAVQINDIIWSKERSLFLAVASIVGAPKVYTSPTGITWTATASANDADGWFGVCWSPQLSLFAAVGDGLSNEIMTSPTGTGSWTGIDGGSGRLKGVCWSPEKSLFVAVGDQGTNRVITSPDGITWTRVTCPSFSWTSVVWSSKLNLFVATSTAQVMTSPTGTSSWTQGSIASDGTITNLLWIDDFIN